MELCVDVGNTNLKWALWEDDVLGPVYSLRHDAAGAQGLEAAWSTLPRPERLLVANVAGERMQQILAGTALRLWRLSPAFARPQQGLCGVTIAYAEPQRFGVDRWLALLAVHNAAMTPALVLDCGTAVTLDAIDGAGNHLGGLILPGLRMMWHGLFAGTRIPPLVFREYREMLGRDTDQCIAGGALQALAGLTERVHRYLQSDHGLEPLIVLTGSDAEKVGGQLELSYRYRPDLVLEGLTHLPD